MFYCAVDQQGEVFWYTGITSLSFTEEQIRQLYRETKGQDLQYTDTITSVENTNLAKKIMEAEKATFLEGEWIFQERKKEEIKSYNVEEELIRTQTALIATENTNKDLGQQVFALQTQLITKGVI